MKGSRATSVPKDVDLEYLENEGLEPSRQFMDWAASDLYKPRILQASPFGGTGATLIKVRQNTVLSDPPTSDMTLQLFTRGAAEVSTDIAGVRYSGWARKGQFGVAPPDAAVSLAGEGAHELDVLVLNGARVREILETDRGDGEGALARLYGRLLNDPRVAVLVKGIWNDIAEGRSESRVYADTALAHLFHYLANLGERIPDRVVGGLAPWQVRRAIEALADADGSTLSLDELAALAGLSPYHFCRAFRQAVGVPPHQYQIGLRIERARGMLEKTDLPITEIAMAVGYESSQALARVFRREVGISPNAYRREARN